MKKTYKIDVDCANCANKMEQAAKGILPFAAALVAVMLLLVLFPQIVIVPARFFFH